MLENKVVVISGVGPALGTTLARRCAEAGADLVLAARTVERLDEVAKQVTDLGRRALAVATDITDDAQVDNLVAESLAAYGKVDVLINNAFRVPSMKPLADTTFQHIRDAIELTVLGALRLTQGFTTIRSAVKVHTREGGSWSGRGLCPYSRNSRRAWTRSPQMPRVGGSSRSTSKVPPLMRSRWISSPTQSPAR